MNIILDNETEAAQHLIESHGVENFWVVQGCVMAKDVEKDTWLETKESVHRYLRQRYSEHLGDWINTVNKWKKVLYMLTVLVE